MAPARTHQTQHRKVEHIVSGRLMQHPKTTRDRAATPPSAKPCFCIRGLSRFRGPRNIVAYSPKCFAEGPRKPFRIRGRQYTFWPYRATQAFAALAPQPPSDQPKEAKSPLRLAAQPLAGRPPSLSGYPCRGLFPAPEMATGERARRNKAWFGRCDRAA